MKKIVFLAAVLLSAALTWFAVSNYLGARPVAEENLRGLALSLAGAIDNIAIHDPSLRSLATFQTHEMAFFAIVDRNGRYRFHSNPDLIGTALQGEIPAAVFLRGVTTDERITLRTGEQAFEFNAPLYLPGETLALRLTLHTYRSDVVIRRARLNMVVLFALLAAGWGLALALYRLSRREERRALEMARRESLAQLGEMGAMLAHEIRNPLAGIKGYAQVIEKKPADERNARFAGRIVVETRRLEELVSDLLDYARSTPDTAAPLDLGEVVSQAAELLQPEADRHGVAITCQCAKGVQVAGNRDRLGQVLLNLGKNALQAMPDGGELRMSAGPAARGALVEVTDNGCGIRPEDLPRIFEPFFTGKAKGTGLGLALCKKIVEEHGGSIEVRSSPGEGTTVTVALPLHQADQDRMLTMKGRILLVEDDETFRSLLQTILEDDGFEVLAAADGVSGQKLIRQQSFDLVLTDLKMPGKSGLELFRETRLDPDPPLFIFITAYGRVDEAVGAMKEGALDFLTKPLENPDALIALVNRALQGQERTRAYLSLKEAEAAGQPPAELIFAGRSMQGVRKLVHDVAPTTASVLIYGESGTGKELVAKTLHLMSPRNKGPFVVINCAAIPENLLESELFGHEKGAFTGALQARLGKFELARGGTIFLDEIGEMPLALQAKLLRVLQERVFERVGGSKEIKADVRVIAATNRNLQDEVAQRRFREDLYYRLNVFPLPLPPLRERIDALPLLAEYFLHRFSGQVGKKLKGIEPEALAALKGYPWPGNIRELQNVMERGVILAQEKVRRGNLPDEILRGAAPEPSEARDVLKSVEKEMILKVLRRHGGNRRLAAAELGISRRTLQYKLKEFGLLDPG